jgi:hypothetical protein
MKSGMKDEFWYCVAMLEGTKEETEHIESSRVFVVSGINWDSLNGALTGKGYLL